MHEHNYLTQKAMQKVSSFSVSFFTIKSKIKPQGVPVYCRITVNQQRFELSTQQYVNPKNWHHGQLLATTSQEKELVQFLASFKRMITQHYYKLVELQEPITAEILKEKIQGKTEKKTTFLEMFDILMNQTLELVNKGQLAKPTWDKQGYAKDKLTAFLKDIKKRNDILLEMVKPDMPHDYYHYLRTKHNLQNNSAMKYIKIARQVLTLAKSKQKIVANPFSEFVCTYIEPDIDPLEMHEIITMWETPMPDWDLEEIRDIYIFCVFTAYAYKDSMSLDEDCIFIGPESSKFITTDRTKTDVKEMVMLLDIPLLIIEKYKNHKCRTIQRKLLPQKPNSHFNKYLKVIAALCGIKKHLTHHTARHTCATTVLLENDVPFETVQAVLGHKSYKSTLRYAKVTKKKIYNNLTVLRNKLNDKNTSASNTA